MSAITQDFQIPAGRTGRLESRFVLALLILTAISFAAQPLGFRPFGLPIALSLITLFNLIWLCFVFRTSWINILVWSMFPIALVLTDLMIGVGSRGIIMANLMLFTMFCTKLTLSESQFAYIWKALTWVCFFLASVGLYRYLNGYVAPFSENENGLSYLQESYFYLGISYQPATRNSEALYFVIGMISAIYLFLKGDRFRFLYLGLAMFQAVLVGLTLSRGAYLAGLMGVFLLLNTVQFKRALSFIGLVCLISVIAATTMPDLIQGPIGLVFDLIRGALISLFDSASANQSVSGFYTYSNSARIELYVETLVSFLRNPFGQGMDNAHFGTPGDHTDLLHSENLYLDLLIIFGIFALILFIKFWQIASKAFRLRGFSSEARMALSIFGLCGLFAMFNSPVNLVIFWFALALGFGMLKCSEIQKQFPQSQPR